MTLRWRDKETGEESSALVCMLENVRGDPALTLTYRVQDEDISITISTQITRSYRDGVRRWGTCPDCGRRVTKLFVPPGGRRFSCRKCLGLSYRSTQQAHRFDSLRRFLVCQHDIC